MKYSSPPRYWPKFGDRVQVKEDIPSRWWNRPIYKGETGIVLGSNCLIRLDKDGYQLGLHGNDFEDPDEQFAKWFEVIGQVDLNDKCREAVGRKVYFVGINGDEYDKKNHGKYVEGVGRCLEYHNSHGLCIIVLLPDGKKLCVDPVIVKLAGRYRSIDDPWSLRPEQVADDSADDEHEGSADNDAER